MSSAKPTAALPPTSEDIARVRRMSLIEDGQARQARMADLAIVGTHSTNGVAQIHSDLLRTRVASNFVELFPERSHRRGVRGRHLGRRPVPGGMSGPAETPFINFGSARGESPCDPSCC